MFNLVNNACQAMKDPGTISIETEVLSKEWVALHIIDTGMGIPPEIMENIFEPFFTTKEKGEGTGLGLSMSQQVIQNFGGDISVESEEFHGARFTVRLPIVAEIRGLLNIIQLEREYDEDFNRR